MDNVVSIIRARKVTLTLAPELELDLAQQREPDFDFSDVVKKNAEKKAKEEEDRKKKNTNVMKSYRIK